MKLATTTTNKQAFVVQCTTFNEAWNFATIVAKSDFAPSNFRNRPENALLAMQLGTEIGLTPIQSLQNIAVINGRPSVYGDAAIALVKASAVCTGIIETYDDAAKAFTCTAKRVGQPDVTVTFSEADAKRAGLWGKSGPWTQYPRRMLQMRARSFALRDQFPDVLKGLILAEEAMDIPTQAQGEHQPAGIDPDRCIEQTFDSSSTGPQQNDALNKVLESIEAASSEDDLKSLSAACKALDSSVQDIARTAYKKKLATLKSQKPKTQKVLESLKRKKEETETDENERIKNKITALRSVAEEAGLPPNDWPKLVHAAIFGTEICTEEDLAKVEQQVDKYLQAKKTTGGEND